MGHSKGARFEVMTNGLIVGDVIVEMSLLKVMLRPVKGAVGGKWVGFWLCGWQGPIYLFWLECE